MFNEQYKEFLYFVIENKELFKSKKLIPVIIDVLEATYEQYPMINFVAAVMEDICKLYFINGDFKFCGPQHENLIHENLIHYSCLHWVHHLIHDVPKEIIELKRDHKTFIFLNKMSREHRAMLLNEVLQNIPRHHSYITWTGETSCSDWKKMYPTITEHTFEPLDFEDVMKANPTQYVPLEHCTKSFLYLTTETYYQNNQIFFTEKTFKPIDLGMPFITLGNPGTMAGLKEIKRRLDSVKNTKKITYAMKLVAAAKLRKAQEAVQRSREYSTALQDMLANLTGEIDISEMSCPWIVYPPW